MIFQPVTQSINPSEVLWLGSLSVFTAVMVWLGRAIIETRDKVRQIVQTLYGSPEEEGRGGIKTTVDRHDTAIDALAREQFSQHLRMRQVENVCVATHGAVLREPPMGEP